MKIGYARVSTDGQKLDMQIDALRRAGCEKIYEDHGESGSKTSRPALNECLASLQRGDQLVVYKLDRLGRSTLHLINMLSEFGLKGIEFQSLSEAIDTASPYGRALFGMLSVFAQLERDVISERVKNGVAAYRKRHKRWGARKKEITLDTTVPVAKLAKMHGVSRNTIYRMLKENQE